MAKCTKIPYHRKADADDALARMLGDPHIDKRTVDRLNTYACPQCGPGACSAGHYTPIGDVP